MRRAGRLTGITLGPWTTVTRRWLLLLPNDWGW
jgi:hypothetical protein